MNLLFIEFVFAQNIFFQIGWESSNSHWIGDGFCDDETNNVSCDFDGGDCCGNNINTQYCTLCTCKE